MKLRLLNRFVFGVVVTLSTLSVNAAIAQPGDAGSATFYCGTSKYQNQSVPTTFARTQDRKKVPMVRWVRNQLPPPWTPWKRCHTVAHRFQKHYDNGTLRYITGDILNGQPVLCAASRSGVGCEPNNVLFTLKPGSDPTVAVRQLLDYRGFAAGRVLNESAAETVDIDFEIYLKNGTDEAQ